MHPALREDFSGLKTDGEEAVVVGDASEFFTYDLLNQAYRKIRHGAAFLALAKNRNFLDHDGELSLDAGPFVAALEYASGREATVLGKPTAKFFNLAVESLRCAPDEVVMIGDDVEADVGGAMAAGLMESSSAQENTGLAKRCVLWSRPPWWPKAKSCRRSAFGLSLRLTDGGAIVGCIFAPKKPLVGKGWGCSNPLNQNRKAVATNANHR